MENVPLIAQILVVILGPAGAAYTAVRVSLNGTREDVRDIKRDVARIRGELTDVRERVARVEGQRAPAGGAP